MLWFAEFVRYAGKLLLRLILSRRNYGRYADLNRVPGLLGSSPEVHTASFRGIDLNVQCL